MVDRVRYSGSAERSRHESHALLVGRRLLRARRHRPRQRVHRAALQDEPDQRHPQVARPAGPGRRPRRRDHVSVAGSHRQDPQELPGRHHPEPEPRGPAQPAPRRACHARGSGRTPHRHDPRCRAPAESAGARRGARRSPRPQPPHRRHDPVHRAAVDRQPLARRSAAPGRAHQGALGARPGARPGQEAGDDQLRRHGRPPRAHRLRRRDARVEDQLPPAARRQELGVPPGLGDRRQSDGERLEQRLALAGERTADLVHDGSLSAALRDAPGGAPGAVGGSHAAALRRRDVDGGLDRLRARCLTRAGDRSQEHCRLGRLPKRWPGRPTNRLRRQRSSAGPGS